MTKKQAKAKPKPKAKAKPKTEPKSRKHNIDITEGERAFMVSLDVGDYERVIKEVAEKQREIGAAVAVKSEADARHKKLVQGLQGEITKLIEEADEGEGEATLKFEQTTNWTTGKIVVRKLGTKTILEQRDITQGEKQTYFDGTKPEDGKAADGKGETPDNVTRFPGGKDGGSDTPATAEGEGNAPGDDPDGEAFADTDGKGKPFTGDTAPE